MRILHVPQGSPEWLAARAGVVTASEIDGILTPAKLLPAKRGAYFNRIVAERCLGKPIVTKDESAFMARGRELEPEARSWYESVHGFDNGAPVDQVGLVLSDDGRLGCSPDGLIGEDGGLEVKCPSAETHVEYALDNTALASAYRGQVQFSLFVTGRKWWDLVSYNPVLSPVVVRIEPDEAYRRALEPAMSSFLLAIDEAVARIS